MHAFEMPVEAAGRDNPARTPQVPRRDRHKEGRDPLAEEEEEDLEEDDLEDEG